MWDQLPCQQNFLSGSFLPCTSRSCGRHWRRLACLPSHVLRAYCNFESKQAVSITLFGRRPNKKSLIKAAVSSKLF